MYSVEFVVFKKANVNKMVRYCKLISVIDFLIPLTIRAGNSPITYSIHHSTLTHNRVQCRAGKKVTIHEQIAILTYLLSVLLVACYICLLAPDKQFDQYVLTCFHFMTTF